MKLRVGILSVFFVFFPAAHAQNARDIFDSATQALGAGNYASAEKGFQRVLTLDPKNVSALADLGVVYSKTHRYAKAIDAYNRALKLSPGEPRLELNLGLVYLKQNDYKRAEPYFRELQVRDPKNAKAALLLATCQVFGDEAEKALPLLKSLADESDPTALYLLGVAMRERGIWRPDKRRSRNCFRRILHLRRRIF
jgi:Flp pilus assembly protein TadD